MTFAQLRSFAAVAQLGSVSTAADALGVSEPAVSSAVAALRRDLGDALFTRGSTGIRLTPGGERLAATAAEILGLEDRLRRDLGAERGERGLLRLAVSRAVAEYVAAPLLDAFTRRWPWADVAEEVVDPSAFTTLVADGRADVALGPAPAPTTDLDVVPFMRYQLVVVAAPSHRLAHVRNVRLPALADDRWLVGSSDAHLERWFARDRLPAPDRRPFVTDAAAQAAAARGAGVMLVVAHTVFDALRRGTLVRLAVRGTPLEGIWHAVTLPPGCRSDLAETMRQFITTQDATQAVVAASDGVPARRLRAPMHVTMWTAGGPGDP